MGAASGARSFANQISSASTTCSSHHPQRFIAIIAIGRDFVISAGGLDLSVGAMVASSPA